jgi:hypothetical protein
MANLCSNIMTITVNDQFRESLTYCLLSNGFKGNDPDSMDHEQKKLVAKAIIAHGDIGDIGIFESCLPRDFAIGRDAAMSCAVGADISSDANGVTLELTIAFVTRWLPPENEAKEMSRVFDTSIILTYAEPGCGLGGEAVYDSGVEVSRDDDHDYYIANLIGQNEDEEEW